jgi:ectoine hydroxylase-related dioxygenase (phytanoyl-CoA dioxygenase family)
MSTRFDDLFIYHRLKPQQLDFYDDQGYLVLGRVLTDKGLESMRREAMAAWEREKGPFDPMKNWLANSLLVNIHHTSETARRFYFSGPIVDVAEQLIGPNLKGATSQLTFKMRGNTMAFGWHQDNGYGELEPYTALTTLTALDDADLDNGCLWLCPGSHKPGQVAVARTAEERKGGKEVVIAADDSKAVPMPMKAGESLIFHCWTLHKSEGNRSTTRDRRILFLRYADADAIEVYNDGKPRLGRLVRGKTRFKEVEQFESQLSLI